MNNRHHNKPHLTRGRRIFLISLFILFTILASCVRNETSSEGRTEQENASDQHLILQQMNETSEQIHQHIRNHLPEQAWGEVQSLSRMLTDFQFTGYTGVEGMAAITAAVTELKGRLHTVKYDETKALQSSSKVRLAIDALMEREQPMWQQYGKTIRMDVDRMKHAASQNDRASLQREVIAVTQHYDIVRPSLLVRNTSSNIQLLDSLITYMNQTLVQNSGTETLQKNQVDHLIAELDKALTAVFEWDSMTAVMTPDEIREQLLFSLVLASIIVTILAYVGWRKYQYDYMEIQPVQQKNRAERKKELMYENDSF